MKMLQCEACRAVMTELAKDVKYLVESDKMWRPQVLSERIKISCLDPAIPAGVMKDACGYMMADFHEAIGRDVVLRWREDAEEFEEDIMPKEFCEKVGVCRENQKPMLQSINEGSQRHKDLTEQAAEKEKSQKNKNKVPEAGSADAEAAE
eukprot:UN4557